MNPQYLGPAILPLERLAKDHPPGDRTNPIPSMFLPCSWFFHRDCHSFALEMDLLRQIYQHKLCIMIACLVDPLYGPQMDSTDVFKAPQTWSRNPWLGSKWENITLYHGPNRYFFKRILKEHVLLIRIFNEGNEPYTGKPISGCGDRDLFTRIFSDAQTENNLGN